MTGENHSQEGIIQSDLNFGAEFLLTIYAADLFRKIVQHGHACRRLAVKKTWIVFEIGGAKLGTCTPNAVGTIFDVILLLHMSLFFQIKLDLCFAVFLAPTSN